MKRDLPLTPHAKKRLFERFGLTALPRTGKTFYCKISNNRKIYQIADIYCVVRKSDGKVITVLTKEILLKGGFENDSSRKEEKQEIVAQHPSEVLRK